MRKQPREKLMGENSHIHACSQTLIQGFWVYHSTSTCVHTYDTCKNKNNSNINSPKKTKPETAENVEQHLRPHCLLSDWLHLPVHLLKAKQSLATLTKDVPKRHSLAMPTETVVNGNNQEWVMQADLPLTAAIRQSQQTLYVHAGHPSDRQGKPWWAHVPWRPHPILTWTDSHEVVYHR